MNGELIWLDGVPLRAINALERAGLTTRAQLAKLSRAELREVRGIGEQGAYAVWRAIGREIDVEAAAMRCAAGHSPK